LGLVPAVSFELTAGDLGKQAVPLGTNARNERHEHQESSNAGVKPPAHWRGLTRLVRLPQAAKHPQSQEVSDRKITDRKMSEARYSRQASTMHFSVGNFSVILLV
jgi:hypothetical protein